MADLAILHEPGYDTCRPVHDPTAFYLSAAITAGILISYLPQHVRIIWNKSSEGIDPLFLLLGATSSASSFLNILALSWASVRCCRFVVSRVVDGRLAHLPSRMGDRQLGGLFAHAVNPPLTRMPFTRSLPCHTRPVLHRLLHMILQSGSSCLESLMGVIQIGAQWACFNLVCVVP